MFFVGREAEVLHAHLVQLVTEYFAALLPAPDDEMRAKAHVVDLPGSDKPAGRRNLQCRDVVRVTGQELLLVGLQVENRDFVANRKD